MNFLSVAHISKKEKEFSLHDISFTQKAFQKIAVAGETGSGKSTLLKIIGGLAQPDSGEVYFEGKRVRGPEERLIPGQPGIAYLSQHFELRNNYRVEEELDYTNKLSAEEASAIYQICDIGHLLKRKTTELSGGERQRIVMARLLISSPRLLLLDEPFSNLDAHHKSIMKKVIHDLGEQLGITCILISHDPADTLSWADEILVMKEGRLLQQGSPEQIYRQPVDAYTAALFGSYNLIAPAQAKAFSKVPGVQLHEKSLLIRPEYLKIAANERDAVKGMVKDVRFFGSYYEVEVQLQETNVVVRTGQHNVSKGDTIFLSLSIENIWYL